MSIRPMVLLMLLLVAMPGVLAQDPAPTERPGSAPYDYVIGAHDLVEISVFELKELDRERRVGGDGMITLPLLGPVALGGLTPKQAEESIGALLKARDLVLEPQVSVFIKEYKSRMITVQGAVANPGAFVMLGQKTLLDMIGEAGGLNDRAGKTIRIHRPFGAIDQRSIEIDIERLVYDGDPLLNVLLEPGDIVMVPYELKIRIYVNGAVRTPGPQEFPSEEEVTALMAITAAGGTTDRANSSKVLIKRKLPRGGTQMIKINLKRIMRGKDEDILLQKNDVIIVRESFF